MNKKHKDHVVLGRYCWTCQRRIANGVPGWRTSRGGDTHLPHSAWDSNADGGFCEGVVWANGDHDKKSAPCSMCGLYCSNPVEYSFPMGSDPYQQKAKASLS